jgi:hypothetical protein
VRIAGVALRTSINLLLADGNSGQLLDPDVYAAVRALAVRVARESRDESWLDQITELARLGREPSV